jgi:hypothetical protein
VAGAGGTSDPRTDCNKHHTNGGFFEAAVSVTIAPYGSQAQRKAAPSKTG